MALIQRYASAFESECAESDLRLSIPAAYATHSAPCTGRDYVFINTAELIAALRDEGFRPTEVIQTASRKSSADYAKHMLRFRHLRDSVTLVDAVPELILINAHDGSSAYQLRSGLYRPVCTNGMMTELGDFGLIRIPHRGNVIANVVDGARQLSRGFSDLGETVAQMAQRELTRAEQIRFAESAALIRYRQGRSAPFPPETLLEARRSVDEGDDLWRVYNVVHEHLLRGGDTGITSNGRRTRSRAIGAIRENVRINTSLWQLAMQLIRG
jgi:hypothetical protein